VCHKCVAHEKEEESNPCNLEFDRLWIGGVKIVEIACGSVRRLITISMWTLANDNQDNSASKCTFSCSSITSNIGVLKEAQGNCGWLLDLRKLWRGIVGALGNVAIV
jgi:hypothetical protein